ncbi:MAG: hypothetical protein AAF220_00820 [Pseudomonadota bacterium]
MMRCLATALFFLVLGIHSAGAQTSQVTAPESPTPLSATPFYRAYSDHPVIEQATESVDMTSSVRSVLADSASPLALRLAIVNALGSHTLPDGYTDAWWRELGYEAAPSGGTEGSNPKITPDFYLLYAYMMALENQLRPEEVEPIVAVGVTALSGSIAAQMIGLLITSQRLLFDGEWCMIWKNTETVLVNQDLDRDLRPGAVAIIAEFLGTYEQDCS